MPNFLELHQLCVAMAASQMKSLKTSGILCGYFARNGSCERGTSCRLNHPWIYNEINKLRQTDLQTLNYLLTKLVAYASNPILLQDLSLDNLVVRGIIEFENQLGKYELAFGWSHEQDLNGTVYLFFIENLFQLYLRIAALTNKANHKPDTKRALRGRKQKNKPDVPVVEPKELLLLVKLNEISEAILSTHNRWLKFEDRYRQSLLHCAIANAGSVENEQLQHDIVTQSTALYGLIDDKKSTMDEIVVELYALFVAQWDDVDSSVAGDANNGGVAPRPSLQGLHSFGSSCSGFGFGVSSDLDLVLLTSACKGATRRGSVSKEDSDELRDQASNVLKRCNDILASSAAFTVSELVLETRVPVIKLLHVLSNTQVDVCVNNVLALQNTELLKRYAECDVRVKQLVLAVKHWSKLRGCNTPHNATLSSYAWTLLVIHFLQRSQIVPVLSTLNLSISTATSTPVDSPVVKVDTSDVVNDSDICPDNAASLLVKFFAYFGTESKFGFRASVNVASIAPTNPPQLVDENGYIKKQSSLSVTSKLWNGDNIPPAASSSRGQRRTKQISAKAVVVSAEAVPVDSPVEVGLSNDGTDVAADSISSDGVSSIVRDVSSSAEKQPLRTVSENAQFPWRWCIEDPLEVHDLGSVVFCMEGQAWMVSEMRRCCDILRNYEAPAECPLLPGTVSGNCARVWNMIYEKCADIPEIIYRCKNCNSTQHSMRTCPFAVCFICHKPGHGLRECPMRRKNNRSGDGKGVNKADSANDTKGESTSSTDSGSNAAGGGKANSRRRKGKIGQSDDKSSDSKNSKLKDSNASTSSVPVVATGTKTKICRFFAHKGRCRDGDSCKFLHTLIPNPDTASTVTSPTIQHRNEKRPMKSVPSPRGLATLAADLNKALPTQRDDMPKRR